MQAAESFFRTGSIMEGPFYGVHLSAKEANL
jgi:hypothetical protein